MTKIGYNKNKAVMGRGTPLQSGIEAPWKNRNFCAVQTVQKDFLPEPESAPPAGIERCGRGAERRNRKEIYFCAAND